MLLTGTSVSGAVDLSDTKLLKICNVIIFIIDIKKLLVMQHNTMTT